MSLRQLVDGDCGGVNPLMQLGGQFTRDAARKDEGFASLQQYERGLRPDEQLVHEFLGQVAAPPQSFQMDTLLQEMREIEQANMGGQQQLQPAPRVIDEVTSQQWAKQYGPAIAPQMVHMKPQQHQTVQVREFFDEGPSSSAYAGMQAMPMTFQQPMMPHLAICPPYVPPSATQQFFEQNTLSVENMEKVEELQQKEFVEDWLNDYKAATEENEQTASSYNEKFWQRLQDEWKKMSEESDHPWLTEFSDAYDPYKEYQYVDENPMAEMENALEKGKEYLAKGDIPSAVLCFEVATRKEPDNAEAWELLGYSQAENEMDPQSIAALKRALELRPENPRVLMALAVCYTNESLQSFALKMLVQWLQVQPKYRHLLEKHPELQPQNESLATTLIHSSKLSAVQELFLEAVRLQPEQVDADVQEALGVLYNLSSEFDKAVDCFTAALHVNPENAKVWNRLGASLANGNRSVEAVDAYQRALELEPGFIRVRYNVGVCCMNLKAYKPAAEHLLTALNMQANSAALNQLPEGAAAVVGGGQQQMSESIWSTLKMVVSLMGRSDLLEALQNRDLKTLNEAFRD